MDILILIVVMALVGVVVGVAAGPIWKENRPIGVRGDYIVAIVVAILTGLLDWFVIPAMGFSDLLKWLGVVLEPPLVALLALWIVRKARE